jgi:hypothetical protein
MQLTPFAAALADETVGEAVVEAVAEGNVDPSCVAGAVANQAIAEGVKRGKKLLGRLGINAAPAVPTAAPCGDSGAAQQPTAAAGPAGAPVPPTEAELPRSGILGRSDQQRPRQQPQRRDCGALGAGCMDGMQPLVACMKEKSFWSEMADAVEQKRDASTDLSAQQRADMDADLVAMRAAHAAGAGRVEPVDPAKPNRHTDWLTPEEYSLAATQASATINAHRQVCNDKHAKF